MAGLNPLRLKPARGQMLAWALCGLLTLGILLTLFDLSHLTARETKRANENGQRAVIDPATGTVSLAASPTTAGHAFDMGSDTSETAAASGETPAPESQAPEAAPETEAAPPASSAPTSPDEPSALNQKDMENTPRLRMAALTSALPLTKTNAESLVAAPAPEVTEKSGNLTLPKRGLGSAMPASIYARRFNLTPDQHLLTFVVLDAGLSAQSLPLILDLPHTVTVAFSPYARDAAARIALFRRAGFEVWSMLPAMGENYPQDDPGPLGLVASLPRDELLRRLETVLAETLGSVGLVLSPNEILSTKPQAFSPVLAELDARGLYLLDTHPAAKGANPETGKTSATLHYAHLFLDPAPDEGAIKAKLAELPGLLSSKERVIVVTSARPQTLLLLAGWLKDHPPEAPAMLAPLSAHWQEAAPEKPAAEAKTPEAKKPDEKKPEKKSAASPEKKG